MTTEQTERSMSVNGHDLSLAGRARHSVRAACDVRKNGGQRTARPTTFPAIK